MSARTAVQGNAFFASLALLGGMLLAVGCGPSYPKCDTDTDCHAGEFCVNGMCQQSRGDQDCPAGQSCASGACQAIPGYCTTTSDCGVGEDCQENVCVQAQTTAAPPPPAPVVAECVLAPVYFEFDSSTLETGARDGLAENAACIKTKGYSSVHVTGLTDPRGTEEYNLALGDRRASSAKKYLKSLGVEAEISHSSMGEELASGADEAGWSQDRRVDIRER